MTKLTASITLPDGSEVNLPASTCSECKGIGYSTEPLVYESLKTR